MKRHFEAAILLLVRLHERMIYVFVKIPLKSMLELVDLEQHISDHRLHSKVNLFAANSVELRAESKVITSLLLCHLGGVFLDVLHVISHLAQVD